MEYEVWGELIITFGYWELLQLYLFEGRGDRIQE